MRTLPYRTQACRMAEVSWFRDPSKSTRFLETLDERMCCYGIRMEDEKKSTIEKIIRDGERFQFPILE
jgi:hypothetical protein